MLVESGEARVARVNFVEPVSPASYRARARKRAGSFSLKNSIRKNVLIAMGVTTLAFSFGAVGASAQGVPAAGTPGEPQCHGERVSAGNHRVERTGPGHLARISDSRRKGGLSC